MPKLPAHRSLRQENERELRLSIKFQTRMHRTVTALSQTENNSKQNQMKEPQTYKKHS